MGVLGLAPKREAPHQGSWTEPNSLQLIRSRLDQDFDNVSFQL